MTTEKEVRFDANKDSNSFFFNILVSPCDAGSNAENYIQGLTYAVEYYADEVCTGSGTALEFDKSSMSVKIPADTLRWGDNRCAKLTVSGSASVIDLEYFF